MLLAHLALTALLVAPPGLAQQDPPARAAAMQREVDRRWREVNEHMRAGRWTAALRPCESMLELEIELLGPRHWDVAGSHHSLALILEQTGDFEEAHAHLEEVLDIAGDFPESPEYAIDARLGLADLDRRRAADEDARERLYASDLLQPEIRQSFGRGRLDEALELVQEQLEARAAVYGDEHHLCAKALHDLGLLHKEKLDLRGAVGYWTRALAIREAALGPEHPLTGQSLNNLGLLWVVTGRTRDAVAMLERSTKILARSRGVDSSDHLIAQASLREAHLVLQEYAAAVAIGERLLQWTREAFGVEDGRCTDSMGALAAIYRESGRYAAAEELLLETREVLRESRRPSASATAQVLANLALLYTELGDVARAIPFLEGAEQIAAEGEPERAPHILKTLNQLAAVRTEIGDTPAGVTLLRRAVAQAQGAFGVESFVHLSALHDLAVLLARSGSFDEAAQLADRARVALEASGADEGPLYAEVLGTLAGSLVGRGTPEDIASARELGDRALAIVRARTGGVHPRFIGLFEVVGEVHLRAGELERAASFLGEARALAEDELGFAHPRLAAILCAQAELERQRGEPERAARLHRRALELSRRNLGEVAAVQSERQQLALLREARAVLDAYLSATSAGAADAADAEELYGFVLDWKGSIFARQARLGAELRQPELAESLAALQELTDRYSALALARPSAAGRDAWRSQLATLAEGREDLERDLARRANVERLRRRRTSPAELRASLSAGVTLVDFLVFDRVDRAAATADRRLVAFVVRRDRPVERVELGPFEPVEAAIEAWRAELEAPAYEASALARELLARLWEPIAKQLEPGGTVLLSADGAVGRLPFAALPGEREASYLVEDFALGCIAAPHLLPELLGGPRDASQPSLLAVGDVDFDVIAEVREGVREEQLSATWRGLPAVGGVAGRARDPRPVDRLPESGVEVTRIAQSFTAAYPDAALERLSGSAATEMAVRDAATRTRFVHLATHGFFLASDSVGSLSSHPGLSSGVILAGANGLRGAVVDDGVLTALEMATLDLSAVRLLTLSACDTGLGAAAGGEGLLGLQRAARVAGARTVLASLWRVPDESTRRLMASFYGGLWREGRAPLAALRHAQLEQIRLRRRPIDWAGWVLAGDWR